MSATLAPLSKTEMGRKSEIFSAGNCFGTGVIYSVFHNSGYQPLRKVELKILERGFEISSPKKENIFIGISPCIQADLLLL